MKKSYYQSSLCILLLLITYKISIAQSWAQTQKIVASDRAENDHFGNVAISGDYAIIGANAEDEDVAGGNTLVRAGAAYIYKNDGVGNWSEVQKIVASDRAAEDIFGINVAINGNYAFIGASLEDEDISGGNTMNDAGAVYIFKNDGVGNWSEVQKIVASDRKSGDNFGISMSSSGDYLIVGALYEDEDASGGNKMLQAGSAYIFKKDAMGNWLETQKIVASDRAVDDQFGWSVGMSGDFAIVGAPAEDEDAAGGNSKSYAGSAYIYKKDGMGYWAEVQKIVASDRGSIDSYGFKVDISGDFAIVGSYWEDEDASGGNTLSKSGSAYIYKKDAMDNWSETQKLVASDRGAGDEFGRSVSIDGDYAIIGAWKQDEALFGGFTLSDAGAAYIFKKDVMGNWSEVQRAIAIDREKSDFFGTSVSISGGYAVVGAYQEDHDISGGNPLTGAGSAYIFSMGPICPTGTYTLPYNPILSGTYRGADDLLTNGTINSSENVTLIGGNSVTLQVGFHATLGCDFIAKIGDCSANLQAVATERIVSNPISKPKPITEESLNLSILPNPVLYNATISYSLLEEGTVQLAIYSSTGQQIATIFNGKQKVGFHAITMRTEQLPSGIYYVVVNTSKKFQHKKIIVMK